MKTNYTKRIESYLSNELSVSEKIEFENELMQNDAFFQEFTLQKQIHLAAERAVIRNEVKSVGKSYHFFKKAKISLAILLAILAVFIGTTFIKNSKNEQGEKFSDLIDVKELVQNLKEELLIDKNQGEIFYWEGNDSIFLSKQSALLSVPKNAFLLHGKPFRSKAVIKWEEALDAPTIMKNGLSTMTNGKLLETQGMVGINAYTQSGEKLTINPKVGLYIQIPVDEYKGGMKLYKGITNKDGVINWVNPKSLQKALVPVDMTLLNFYPEGYEAKLDELKLPISKIYRDSLYLSFDKTKAQKMEAIEEKVIPFEQYNGENLFKNNCSSCHKVFKDDIGPKLYKVRNLWEQGGAKDSSIYTWVNNWQEAADLDPYAHSKIGYSKTAMKQFPELTQEEIDAIFDFIDSSPSDLIRVSGKRYYAKDKLKTNPDSRDADGWIDKIKWSFTVKYDGNGEATIISKAKLEEGWYMFSSQHDPKKSNKFGFATRIRLRANRNFSIIGNSQELEEPSLYNHKRGTILGFKNEAIFTQKIKITNSESFYVTGIYRFQICDENMSLFPPDQQFTIKIKGYGSSTSDSEDETKKIPPSKVLAFWKPEFNNTLLATREFERRMKEIHTTGDQRLLDIYTQNLQSTMEQLDQKAVDLGYPQFQKFVDEHVGGISTTKSHLKALKKFYSNTVQEFKETLEKNYTLKNKIEKAWNKKVLEARDKEHIRTRKRKEQAANEEYLLNMRSIAKQLDLDDRKIKHLGKSVGFRVIEFGNYNIDQRIFESTILRQSTEMSDDKLEKTIKIEYSPFQMEIENAHQYDLLFAYLLPDKLNSYERIIGRKGKFDYPLNKNMNYDVAIIGVNHDSFFYAEIQDINNKPFLQVDLEKVTETVLNKKIELMNINRGVQKPMSISEEIEWLVIEQKNYVIEKQRKEEKVFRDLLHDIIFPSNQKRSQKR